MENAPIYLSTHTILTLFGVRESENGWDLYPQNRLENVCSYKQSLLNSMLIFILYKLSYFYWIFLTFSLQGCAYPALPPIFDNSFYLRCFFLPLYLCSKESGNVFSAFIRRLNAFSCPTTCHVSSKSKSILMHSLADTFQIQYFPQTTRVSLHLNMCNMGWNEPFGWTLLQFNKMYSLEKVTKGERRHVSGNKQF